MLGELSGLWAGEGDVKVEGSEPPTPSLMACSAFRELLEKVVVLLPLPPPLPMPLIGECIPPGENWLVPIFGLPLFLGDIRSPCWGPPILGLPEGLFMPLRPNPPLLWNGGCCGCGCMPGPG